MGLTPAEQKEFAALRARFENTKQSYLDEPYEPGQLNAGALGFKTPREAIGAGLDALPLAGQVGGGLLASESGPAASIAAAGAGGAIGGGLRDLGHHYILGEKPQSTSEIMKDMAGEGAKGAIYEGGGQLTSGLLKSALQTKLGQAALEKAGDIGAGLIKATTGVPEINWKTYAKNVPEIEQFAKDQNYDRYNLGETAKRKINQAVQDAHDQLNQQLTQSLANAPKDANIDVSPVIEKLEQFKGRYNESFNPEIRSQLDEMINRLKSGATPTKTSAFAQTPIEEKLAAGAENQPVFPLNENGPVMSSKASGPTITEIKPGESDLEDASNLVELPRGRNGAPKYMVDVNTLQQARKMLKGFAKGAFGESPIGFQVGRDAAQGARGAYNEASDLMHELGPKDIADADAKLSRLHGIEDRLNSRTLDEGGTPATILSAGSGANEAQAHALEDLGRLIKSPALEQAQNASAAATLGKAPWLPVDTTGKSFTRLGTAGFLGHELDPHSPLGWLLGAAVSSPKIMKGLVKGGYYGSKVLSNPEVQGLLLRKGGGD